MDELKDIIEKAITVTAAYESHRVNVPELKRALVLIEREIDNLKRRLDGES